MANKNYPPIHLKSKIRQTSETIFKALKPQAEKVGWCLVAHGSMERDLDILAIPWVDTACEIKDLIVLLRETVGKTVNGRCYSGCEATVKPHGRRAYTLFANSDDDSLISCENGTFPFIDLSVVDLRPFLNE